MEALSSLTEGFLVVEPFLIIFIIIVNTSDIAISLHDATEDSNLQPAIYNVPSLSL